MSSAKRSHQVLVVAEALMAASISVSTLLLTRKYLRRQQRTKLIQQDNDDDKEQDTIPSIIAAFESMQLDDNFTVEEANKRRTGVYYERARDAHEYDLCPGVRSYPRLRNRREAELKRIFRYHNEGNKSHRTIIVMLDNYSASILLEARHSILAPLNYSTFIETTGVWIPECNLLPREDLHVTVAIPWWWHTIRDQNRELSQELVARFRSALVYEFHHPFQIELERIVLLGGKALVALWRTVGERKADDGVVTIYDRHGETIDPFVKLRADIVKCFSGSEEILGPPLTYSTRHVSVASPAPIKQDLRREEAFVCDSTPPIPPPAVPSSRQNTIELKTPGLGQHDGFIHTTLARLPLDCLSMSDVELAPIHRLCREATVSNVKSLV